MNFVAIDFETANHHRTSACSIGLAYVTDGHIVDERHFYIRPEPFEFDDINVSIHGITEHETKDAPDFLTVWESILPTLRGLPILAHNAAFDMSVIRYCLNYYGYSYPDLQYYCSMCLAKALIPNAGCYRLDYLCLYNAIELDHHDAMSDARACASLFINLCKRAGISGIPELKESQLLRPGLLYDDGYVPCSVMTKSKSAKPKQKAEGVKVVYLDEDFYNKHFAFTGVLSIPRDTAEMIVKQTGGIVDRSVTKQTNYLVCGMQSLSLLKGRSMSTKEEKALKLAESGQDIQIIREDDFMNMIDAEFWEKSKEEALL